MSQFSDILISRRESKGWKKSEMARQLGLSSQLYGQYEQGKRNPGSSFFIAWKKLFGDDLTEIILSEKDTVTPIQTAGKILSLEATLTVLVDEMIALKAKVTGEHETLIKKRFEKAAQDVLGLLTESKA